MKQYKGMILTALTILNIVIGLYQGSIKKLVKMYETNSEVYLTNEELAKTFITNIVKYNCDKQHTDMSPITNAVTEECLATQIGDPPMVNPNDLPDDAGCEVKFTSVISSKRNTDVEVILEGDSNLTSTSDTNFVYLITINEDNKISSFKRLR